VPSGVSGEHTPLEEEPIFDKKGKPTGRTVMKNGKDGVVGYLRWAAKYRANAFIPQLGRIIPLHLHVATEEKTIVHYETVEERRAAMVAKGWDPSVVAARFKLKCFLPIIDEGNRVQICFFHFCLCDRSKRVLTFTGITVAMLVYCAPLHRHAVPDGGNCLFKPWQA
jgi:hypothetical protein